MTNQAKLPEEIATLGEAIRYLRELQGLTLRALARELGISAPFLSDIEHNKRSTNKLAEFAKALGVAKEELEKLDGRLPEDLKKWLSDNPDYIEYLKEVRDSKHSPTELRAALAKIKR